MVQEPALDKQGKVAKDPKGEKQYKRDDYVGLLQLLNRFDSRLHTIKDYKSFTHLKDNLLQHWAKEDTTVDLSLDEATFLKEYLKTLPDKEGKEGRLAEFEIRTLIGILEQLE